MPKEFKPVKISVVGTICWDKIVHPEGKTSESFGGIAYTILTLASLLESKLEVFPVCLVGKDRYQEVIRLFKKNPEINLNGIKSVEQKNNTVTLTYKAAQSRDEILEGGVPSLSFEQIKPFLEADYLLVNFISGWDIGLDTLERMKKNTKGKIYLDVHSLTLGKDEKGKRFIRKPKDWEKYAAGCDYLQLNQIELETILGRKLSLSEIEPAARNLLDLGPKGVIITLSDKGCHLAYKSDDRGTVSKLVKARPVSSMVDTTGCGDVFGAGFLANLIACDDPVQAADFANYLAGLKASFTGLEGLRYFTPLDLEFT